MAPKGDSSKKNTKKNPTPKFDYKLVNKDTKISSSSGDTFKYLIKG